MIDIFQDIRNKIVELLTKLGLNSREAVIIIMVILTVDLFLLHKKNQAKKQFILNQEEGKNEDDERYVEYYKQKQYIYTLRGIMRAVVILSFILYHNPNIFAGLAIALGAFVISFGSVFLSFGLYLYLISFYSPGQCVKIGDITGEIVSITPLYLKLLGRNESGDHDGELINIPNHQVRQNKISLVDLDLGTVQKTIIDIYYSYDQYNLSFNEFVPALRDFLDATFPLNTTKMADHYKSYKGYKYKLTYDIDKDGKTIISLGFLSKRSKTPEFKYKIVEFLESLKKTAAKHTKGNQQSEQKTTSKNNTHPLQAPFGSGNVV